MMSSIEIKRIVTAQGFDQAVELQKVYWGRDANDLVPRHMLHTLCLHGSHLLGAYDGTRLIGFVMGFLGAALDAEAPEAQLAASNLLILSKRMLVLSRYRGRNIGFKLKMAQRDLAIEQGIDLVTWTFDPLLAANAHLNLRKLGAISSRFAVNYFNDSDSQSLLADRLIVHWGVKGERAQACAAGDTSARTLQQCLDESTPILNVHRESGPAIAPGALSRLSDADCALVEIPSDIRHLDEHQPEAARRWRLHIRELLGRLIESGYVVYDFLSAGQGRQKRAYYFLRRENIAAKCQKG